MACSGHIFFEIARSGVNSKATGSSNGKRSGQHLAQLATTGQNKHSHDYRTLSLSSSKSRRTNLVIPTDIPRDHIQFRLGHNITRYIDMPP